MARFIGAVAAEGGATLVGGIAPAELEGGKLKTTQLPAAVPNATAIAKGLVPTADGAGKIEWKTVSAVGGAVASVNGRTGEVTGLAELQEKVQPINVPNGTTILNKTLTEVQIWIATITAETNGAKIQIPNAVKGESLIVVVKYGGTVRVPEFSVAAGGIRWEKGSTYTHTVETTALANTHDYVSFICIEEPFWDAGVSLVAVTN